MIPSFAGHRLGIALASGLLFCPIGAAFAQPPDSNPPRPAAAESPVTTVSPTTVEILVEAKTRGGRLRTDLVPRQFLVTEDGIPVTVMDLELLGDPRSARDAYRRALTSLAERPWRFVLYFDLPLMSDGAFGRLVEGIRQQAAELTALGSVEVVVADPRPEIRLAETRDPKLLQGVVDEILHSHRHSPHLAELRRRYLDSGLPLRLRTEDPDTWDLAELRRQIRAAARAEHDLVAERIDNLGWWLASYPPKLPKGVIWVGEGFDLDLAGFYLAGLPRGGFRDQLEEDLAALHLGPEGEGTARVVAGLGWTVLPLWVRSVRRDLVPAEEDRLAITVSQDSLVRDAVPSLEIFAAASAGRVVVPVELERLLPQLNHRWILTYRAPRPPDDALHKIGVSSPHLRVQAPGWRSTPQTPEGLAAIAGGERSRKGGLSLSCEKDPTPAEPSRAGGADTLRLACDVRVDGSQPRQPGERTSFLLSVFGHVGGARRERFDVEIEAAADAPRESGLLILASLPERLRSQRLTVVLFEEASERYALTEVAAAEGGSLADAGALFSAAAGKPIHLLPFDRPMVAGAVLVEAQVTRPDVSRVEFLLDGRQVNAVDRRPFEAWLRFGPLPEPHIISAVAYGAGGQEVGRDELRVNQGLGRHRVRLLTPPGLAGAPPYDVEVDVAAPPSAPATKVELFWNRRSITSFEHPPYRARVSPPAAREGDYLRAVATFADGETHEDTVVKSRAGFDFRTDVDMIELYAVARDALGRPIADLDPDEIAVLEDGRRQEIVSFGTARDVPLRLALTIDVSESMFDRMPMVRSAAQEFVDTLLEPEDRLVLSAFNHRPFLLQGPTADPDLLSSDIVRLPAVGGTALFDAIIYSLLQLRDLKGRKAVVLLTDGKDKHSRFSLGDAQQFARRSSIPVYLIRTTSPGASQDVTETASLERLARLTGGALYQISSTDRLPDIYETISEELRHQYVIAYQSDDSSRSDSWRSLELVIDRPGARVRTIAGYFPQH